MMMLLEKDFFSCDSVVRTGKCDGTLPAATASSALSHSAALAEVVPFCFELRALSG